MLPPSLFSARWWPVAEELKGSKMDLVGFAARGVLYGMVYELIILTVI